MNRKSSKMFVILTLLVLWCAVSLPAGADTSGTCGSKLTWTLNTEGTLTISGKGRMYNWSDGGPWGTDIKKVIIQSGVTSIGEHAFSTCRDMTSIELPAGMTEIGSSAFLACENLESVSIPEGVTKIGRYAFFGCTNLKSANLPEGLTSLENWVFNDCRVLSDVQIPGTVTSIGDRAFYNCDGITELVIPEGVTSIGESAFVNCSSLSSVIFPQSLKSIGDYAFEICYLLSRVEFSEGLTNIGVGAFQKCSKLTSVVIPKTVTNIGESAFSQCSGLSKLIISEGVTHIDKYAFNACSSLASVRIPESLVTLEESVFRYCQGLTSVILPKGINRIGRQAFENCNSLTAIRLPDGITTIGAGAFAKCSSLKNIVIPESVTSIENQAFANCTALTYFEFPKNLTNAGYYAFQNCSSLTSITIWGSSMYFDENAFQGCSNLKQIYMPGSKQPVYSLPSQLTRLTFYCYEYTDIDFWAMEKGYNVKYLDSAQLDIPLEFGLIPDTTQLFVGESTVIIPRILPPQNDPVISWSSSNPQVASVNDGTVIAYAPGQTTITAVYGNASASIDISVHTILTSFSIEPSELWMVSKTTAYADIVDILPDGAISDFTIGGYNSNVASITLNEGQLTIKGLRPDDTMVTITDELSGVLMTLPIHVCYPVTSLYFAEEHHALSLGESKMLTLVVTTQNQTLQNRLVTFSSSNPEVVTVDNQGNIIAVGYGTAEIFAVADNSLNASCVVSVCEHIIESLPAVPATCTEYGLSEGEKCSVCDKVVTPQEILPMAAHTEKTLTGIPATHVTTGLSDGIQCVICDTIVSEQIILPIIQVNISYLPGAVATIDAEAFMGCRFECVVIDSDCKEIGDAAFADNSMLRFVEIPVSVTNISASAFSGCSMDLVIVTPAGSAAEAFALEHGIQCVAY